MKCATHCNCRKHDTTNCTMQVIVLPGLDGTAVLREPFALQLSAALGVPVHVVPFPGDRLCTYEEVQNWVEKQLPAEEPFALIGESFSGPIALRLSLKRPQQVWALVLVGTYVTNPWPFPGSLLRPFIRPILFRVPPPPGLIRKFIVSSTAADDLMPLFQRVVRELVKPQILACRLRSCTQVDAREELRRCPAPILQISAEKERILPRNVDDEIRKLRPDIEDVRLPCGHCILECYPDLATPVIATFLQKHLPAVTAT